MFKKLDGTTKYIFIICLGFITTGSVRAEIILQTLKNGLVASADFHQGEADAPVILIQHGFLQTRQAHTVARLFNALVDSDYTVLSPTLTLDINQRKQSLACEAIHSHSMQSDNEEIDFWSHWLHKKTAKKIILIGHSTGSVQQIAYLNNHNYDHIKKGIFISMGYFGNAPGSNETEADNKRAQSLLKKDTNSLNKYGLSYCKDYVTTAEKYLSYYEWQPEKILHTMKKTKLPITVIIGSKDKRISKSWGKNMKDNGINTITINGAGHFFDEEYEFDLQDTIELSITNG